MSKNPLINIIPKKIDQAIKAENFSNTKKSLLSFYQAFITKIYNTEKFNLDEESLFIEFKSKILNG